jgi:hypothetical protein
VRLLIILGIPICAIVAASVLFESIYLTTLMTIALVGLAVILTNEGSEITLGTARDWILAVLFLGIAHYLDLHWASTVWPWLTSY